MKATQEMIQAVEGKFPELDAQKAKEIIQVALDADSLLSKMEYVDFSTSNTESNKYTPTDINQRV